MKSSRLWTLACAVLLAMPAGSAPPGADPGLRPGVLLVAAEQLVDLNFTRAVVLILDYGPGGALGIIVNRPTTVAVATVLEAIPEAQDYTGELFIGGPIDVPVTRVLARADAPPPASREVVPGVHYLDAVATVQALLRDGASRASLRFYAGYAGWSPGQLDVEVGRGDWAVLAGDAASVFTPDPAGLWRQLHERSRQRWAAGPCDPRAACDLFHAFASHAAALPVRDR